MLKNNKVLTDNGLNLQAVLDINLLPGEVKQQLKSVAQDLENFSQLILIGHGGTLFWRSLKNFQCKTKDPIDEFSITIANKWLGSFGESFLSKIIYPGSRAIGLQKLGQLAGWHHPSPFMIGINHQWGSWFAYRTVILANSDFPASLAKDSENSPCLDCKNKKCLTACPADAVKENSFSLDSCIQYRKQKNSSCSNTCLSRISCPVATEHRYDEEQISYHYQRSLETILKLA